MMLWDSEQWQEACSWVRLALTRGTGQKIIYQALDKYKTPEETCKFLEKQCPAAVMPKLEEAQKHIENHLAKGYKVVTPASGFPKKLFDLTDYPLVLYLSGKGTFEDIASVAIVGSRRATPYGLQMAEKLACELAERDMAVISGMARGIDTSAHKGAVKAEGITWAVLGCGIDICYPHENKKLRAQIEEKGLIISEYPMGTTPTA
ncbi:MAG: DNA-protecting protein DprA, partial [bacterium]|nr:DNA-protecting protein DprA [bacterium]